MKVLNVHIRKLDQPKKKIEQLFATLAAENEMMLATTKWPPMILDDGMNIGSKGGHGPIRYSVKRFRPGHMVEFKFYRPKGFIGTHKFEINKLDSNKTELKHVLDMKAKGAALIIWPLAIRWLHDAYIEDAFDRVENHFSEEKIRTEWNFWVKLLRRLLKPKTD